MKKLHFVKVVGAGNDFILIDARRRRLPMNPSALAKNWCDRRQGIGADGLLLVLPSKRGDARMRIFNPDGSEASMCGNGLRCVGWYLERGTPSRNGPLSIETGAGVLPVKAVGRQRVRIWMTPPRGMKLRRHLSIKGTRLTLHSVNTGVPHAVLVTPNLEEADLAHLGPCIRRHRSFQPGGTNVDWMQVESPRRIAIRTYERGVEAETLACGTGAVASVVIGTSLGRLAPPVHVRTASAEKLLVHYASGHTFEKGAILEGPARILFEGTLSP